MGQKILLRKMHHLGVRDVCNDWFASYLSGRRQCVRVNGVSSDYQEVLMGVPQGSCIGPTLFLLYVNDMYKCCPGLNLIHFADDTTAFKSDNLDSLIGNFNSELGCLDQWLCYNRLSLNVSKTKYMITSNRNTLNHRDIVIRGRALSRVSEVNFLGVQIDAKLKFDGQVKHVTGKLSRVFGVMRKLRSCTPASLLNTIYYSLAYPYLTYAVVAWGNCGRVEVSKLETAQRRLVRILCGENPPVYRPPIDFNSIKILYSGVTMHKIQNGNYHDFLTDRVSSLQVSHGHLTRFKVGGNLVGPKCRTTKTQQSFVCSVRSH